MKYFKLMPIVIILSGFTVIGCAGMIQTRDVFVVDMNSPQIPIGEIELQFDRFLSMGSLRGGTATVIYFPREDAVLLRYRHELTTYNQFWSRQGRQVFISALAKYNEDYEARVLNTRAGRRERSIYGTVEGYLVWYMHRFAVRSMGNMNVGLGYTFSDRLPYFTIHQREARFEDPMVSSNNRTSPVITMYFTREQAAVLESFFRQDFLDELVSPGASGGVQSIITDINTDIERDDY